MDGDSASMMEIDNPILRVSPDTVSGLLEIVPRLHPVHESLTPLLSKLFERIGFPGETDACEFVYVAASLPRGRKEVG